MAERSFDPRTRSHLRGLFHWLPSLLSGVALWGAVAAAGTGAPEAAEPPVAVFADLDGTWEGTFVGWDRTGRELYRLRVRQTYQTVDESTQRVEIEDRLPDGSVVTGRGENVARRTEDGGIELRCRVEKSNGERVEHQGRLTAGPDGRPVLVWHSRGEDRWEVFRERVRREGEAEVYRIDGVGRYGGEVVVMAGRYHRVAGSTEEGKGDPSPEETPARARQPGPAEIEIP